MASVEEQVKEAVAAALKERKGYKKNKKAGKTHEGEPPKKSGVTLVKEFKYKDGVGPMLWGWRISKKFGFMTFTAYLSKDMGRPKDGKNEDKCLVMVVNIRVKGLGKLPPQSAVWSKQYHKLTMSDAELVANPNARRGGYWGRGGSEYKDKVNS